MLFDSHCHIHDEAFDADRAEVFQRARDAGVTHFLLPASNVPDARAAFELAQREANCYSAISLHPQEAADWTDETARELAAIYDDAKALSRETGEPVLVRAVGEIGLDYYYENSPRDIQKDVYRKQLELAHELDLPIIIHERDAFQDSYEILKQAKADGLLKKCPGVCHCFSGSRESAELLMDLGFMLGFDGPITFKNARKAPEIVATMPLDRLVLETDSPYLSPHPFRGKRNEPMRVVTIAEKAAELRGVTLEEVAEATFANTLKLYELD